MPVDPESSLDLPSGMTYPAIVDEFTMLRREVLPVPNMPDVDELPRGGWHAG